MDPELIKSKALQNSLYLYELVINLDLNTLNHLCSTSRQMMAICQDDTFWKNKFFHDFSISNFKSTLPWKETYQRMVAPYPINEPITVSGIDYGIIDEEGKFYYYGKNVWQLKNNEYLLRETKEKNTLIHVPFPDKVISVSYHNEFGYFILTKNNIYNIMPLDDYLPIMLNSNWKKLMETKVKAIKIATTREGYMILMNNGILLFGGGRDRDYISNLDFKIANIFSDGSDHFNVISENGELYHLKRSLTEIVSAEKIQINEPVKWYHGGRLENYALTESGKVYIWGEIEYDPSGKLLAEKYKTEIPQLLNLPKPISRISSGKRYSVAAISIDGDVYIWGSNSLWQLLQPKPTFLNFPDYWKEEVPIGNAQKYYAKRYQKETYWKPKSLPNILQIEMGPIKYMALGSGYVLSVTVDGIVNYWGASRYQPI